MILAEGHNIKNDAPENIATRQTEKNVRIVGIGASAGGLDPIERFFDGIPPKSNMAFVVVQHLSPNFKSMMNELLARHSSMPIRIIENDTVIEPNTIYLNQPRLVPFIENGVFKSTDTSESIDPNLPINAFFTSLAKERGDKAIAIVLSGTGTDGTHGCEAIKAAGGAVFVQEPHTAKFDGMPNSIINEELSDVIATPEELSALIVRYSEGTSIDALNNVESVRQSPIEHIYSLIEKRFGTDFNAYKPSTIERRIRRRYEMCGLNNYQDYADKVATDRDEMEALYNDLLIDVTAFFRDGEGFDMLWRTAVAKIGAQMTHDHQVRVWVPACSSGEEPYSIAMLFADYARENNVPLNVKILATDIHHRSLNAASSGVYPEDSMKSISAERIGRYFDKKGNLFHLKPEIRRVVVFTAHSLFQDPPFTRMDLVSCRNMLIYFKEPAQQKAIALFHFALNKNGYLFLGPSETVGGLVEEFETVDQRWRLYQKRRDIRLMESTTVLRDTTPAKTPVGNRAYDMPRASLRNSAIPRPEVRRAISDAFETLLERYAPAGFLTTLKGDLVQIFGDAARYTKLSRGAFSQHIQDIVHPDLELALASGFERVNASLGKPFTRRARYQDGDVKRAVTISVESLPGSTGEVEFLLIVFKEDTAPTKSIENVAELSMPDDETTLLLQSRVRELERDLTSTEESLQTTIEELETANEELQATNEELMASNEELQSTNEELQSVNEELYTVSAEHQRKIHELIELTNDMDQLLKSTDIGTIFVDGEMRIRRYTPAATKTFNLISQDIGRPFTHVTHNFADGVLEELIKYVRNTGEPTEKEVKADGRSYLLRVLPYTKLSDGPMEMVITIIDIDDLRLANAKVVDLASFYQSVLSDIDDFIIRWRFKDGAITYCNSAYAKLLGKTPDDMLGQNAEDLFPEDQREALLEAFDNMVPGDVTPLRVTQTTCHGREIFREGYVRAIGKVGGNDGGEVIELQSTSRDATQDIRYLESLESLVDTTQSADDDYLSRLAEFLKTGRDFFGLEHGILRQRDHDILRIEAYYGEAPDAYPIGVTANTDMTLCSIAQDKNQVLHIHDLEKSAYKDHSAAKEYGIKSYIGAPVSKDGEVYGSICFFSKAEPLANAFTTSQISFVLLLSHWISYKLERRSQLLELQRSERELNFIFDNVPVRIWYKDDKNGMLKLNKTAAESMGMSVEDVEGRNTYDLFPEFAKKYHDDDLAVLNSQKPRHGIIEEYTPLDGPRGWVSTDKIPFDDEETGDRNLLVVSTDVTDLKLQELALQDLNKNLAQANDGLKQFAYVASHDLQEPLRKIQQFSHLLNESYLTKLDEDGQYFLSVVSSSAVRMSSLIRDLLSYSKTSYHDVEPTKVDLNALLAAVKDDLGFLLEESDASVSFSKFPTISADETMVKQLFTNLIGNGVKYRARDRAPVIKVSSRRSAQALTITVKDNAMGMDEQYLDRIFEPFTRLQNDEELTGTGIGLAICKTVCDRHGWTIGVQSKPGEGSTFKIVIPDA